jgi:hypothetical protein
MLKTLLSFSLAFLFCQCVNGQGPNLVPNGGFEDELINYCGIMTNLDFNLSFDSWQTPTNGSPDLYSQESLPVDCYNLQPVNEYPGPIGIKGTQFPNNSNMIGAGMFTINGLNQREYFQVELNEQMVPGHTYEVSYLVSFADFVEYSIDKIGIHFSVAEVGSNNNQVLDLVPQLESNVSLDNYEDWVLVSTTFIADEGYWFMTVGNFNNDNNTVLNSNPNASGEPGTYGAYYFFDDFSVIDLDAVAVKDFVDAGIKLFPNPVKDILQLDFANAFEKGELKILDINGQIVFSQQVNSELNLRINTSNFIAGTYIIEVENDDEMYIERFVKL